MALCSPPQFTHRGGVFVHWFETCPSSAHCEQVVSGLRQYFFVCPMRWQVKHRIGLGRYASISSKCQLTILMLWGRSGLLNVIMYRWVGSITPFTFLFILSIFITCWSDSASISSSMVECVCVSVEGGVCVYFGGVCVCVCIGEVCVCVCVSVECVLISPTPEDKINRGVCPYYHKDTQMSSGVTVWLLLPQPWFVQI